MTQQCIKSAQCEQALNRKVTECEQLLADNSDQWQQVKTIIAQKLQAIEWLVIQRLNQQLHLMRQHQDQEIWNFYNRFGCRGFQENQDDLPRPKRIKAHRPEVRPMITEKVHSPNATDITMLEDTGSPPSELVVCERDHLSSSLQASGSASGMSASVATVTDASPLFVLDFLTILDPSTEASALAVHPKVDGDL